jgi:hypothetical protein
MARAGGAGDGGSQCSRQRSNHGIGLSGANLHTTPMAAWTGVEYGSRRDYCPRHERRNHLLGSFQERPLLPCERVSHLRAAVARTQQMNKRIDTIPPEVMESLTNHPLSGNIRELQNFIERSVILSPGTVLEAPLFELTSSEQQGAAERVTLKDAEPAHILRILRESDGVPRSTLFYKNAAARHRTATNPEAATRQARCPRQRYCRRALKRGGARVETEGIWPLNVRISIKYESLRRTNTSAKIASSLAIDGSICGCA